MKGFITALLVFFSLISAFAQKEKKIKSKRLTKVEAADMTREQKLVHESERKSKKNKPVDMRKKIKLEIIISMNSLDFYFFIKINPNIN